MEIVTSIIMLSPQILTYNVKHLLYMFFFQITERFSRNSVTPERWRGAVVPREAQVLQMKIFDFAYCFLSSLS